MPTYSVFTPLDDPDKSGREDLLIRFLTMRYRLAGTLEIEDGLEAHVRPGSVYIEHRTGTVRGGATMLLTMRFGAPAIETTFGYPVETLGDLFALTGYDAFADRTDSTDAVAVRIYAVDEPLVDRALRIATDGRIQTGTRNEADGRPVRLELDNAELVRFVVTLYGEASRARAELGAPNLTGIPLKNFYASIMKDDG